MIGIIALTAVEVVDFFRSIFGSKATNREGLAFAERIVQEPYEWQKDAADGAAATATAEQAFALVTHAGTLLEFSVLPSAALTADAANNATITIRRRPAADPATPQTLATLVTDVAGGSWVAWTKKAFTLANTALLAGDVLTVQITKGGTGVVVPAGDFVGIAQ